MAELPTSCQYVKNSAIGKWWPDAKATSRIHAGWSNVPDEMIQTGDLILIDGIIPAPVLKQPARAKWTLA